MQELEKSQAGRLQTMIVFVPIVVFFAFQTNLTTNHRFIIAFVGASTLVLTTAVYLENEKRLNQ